MPEPTTEHITPTTEPTSTNGVASSAAERKPIPKKKQPPAIQLNPFAPYRGVAKRLYLVIRHLNGLLAGALVARKNSLPPERRRYLRSLPTRMAAVFARPFVRRSLAHEPFPVQLRRRLELLGPTYVKLGQVMAIREDVLPPEVTTELRNLMDQLPAIPFEQVRERIEYGLQRPVEESFRHIDPDPLGSASIAQAHLAETVAGEKVVVKVIKPGVRQAIRSDLTMLRLVGKFLQWILPRYQPQQVIDEFCAYTSREVDYIFEADHAEIFSANFQDNTRVRFPKIYRRLSSQEVLTMEFMDGVKPSAPELAALTLEQKRDVIDLGSAAIIRMLFQDGFFHADLHAGNLMIFPANDPIQIGFIDLGMVGRFPEKTKRQMLYYFNALVSNDIEGAAQYLSTMARTTAKSDLAGFRRAVMDTLRRFVLHAGDQHVSLAQMILESVGLGGKYRVFFPVEMTLMVKALVTFEGVGKALDPNLNIPEVSRKHAGAVFRHHFNPQKLVREFMRQMPEAVDVLVRSPQLLASGVRFLEETVSEGGRGNPLAGLRSSILAGSCILGAVLALVQGGPILLAIGLFLLSGLLALWGK